MKPSCTVERALENIKRLADCTLANTSGFAMNATEFNLKEIIPDVSAHEDIFLPLTD